ncbi:hypothetical protein [Sphaerospermopsis sp. LEGE 08334]|nr:hypothetical protein [Sphaerospermopsis sp. LEGE 08334]
MTGDSKKARGKRQKFILPNYPLPITHYQLPITNYQLPITHYQLPLFHNN